MSRAEAMSEEHRTHVYWQQNYQQGAQGATGWDSYHRLTSRQRRRIDKKAHVLVKRLMRRA